MDGHQDSGVEHGVESADTWAGAADSVRGVLHPLIDLEQFMVVLLVCTRMQKETLPSLPACLCGSPD